MREFSDFHASVHVWDPWTDPEEVRVEYGIELVQDPQPGQYDAMILALGHRDFIELGAEHIRALGKPEESILFDFDVKYVRPRDGVDARH